MDKYKKVKTTDRYSDFYNDLTSHPDTKQVMRLVNKDAVDRSMRNIILTDIYERPFSKIGSNIKASLFENITPQLVESLKDNIKESIGNYEPRVKVIDVEVNPYPDDNRIDVIIYYYLVNRSDPVSTSITIYRVR